MNKIIQRLQITILFLLITVLLSVINAQDVLPLYLSYNFDTSVTTELELGEGWRLKPDNEGQVLHVSKSTHPLKLSDVIFENVTIEFDFRLGKKGAAQIRILASDIGAYIIRIGRGRVILFRNKEKLAEANFPKSSADQWHSVHMSVLNNQINIKIDDVQLITVQDNTFTEGKISIRSAHLKSKLSIDNLTIWGTPIEAIRVEPDGRCIDSPVRLKNYDSTMGNQVLIDMGVIVPGSAGGMRVLRSPIINSKLIDSNQNGLPDIFAWGSLLQVYTRVQFGTLVGQREVWYKVSPDGQTTPKGWIVIEYPFLNSYLTESDPCPNPINGNLGSNSYISFNYDRRAVSLYGSLQARQNNLGLNNRPTTLTIGSTYVMARHPQLLRFGNFQDADLSDQPGETGSGLFTSQLIWLGGLPMTVGIDSACPTYPHSTAQYGWKHCSKGMNQQGVPISSSSTANWDVHEGVLKYYTDVSTLLPQNFGVNTVLQTTSKGHFLNQLTGFVNINRITRADLTPYLTGMNVSGSTNIGVIDSVGLAIKIRGNLGIDVNNTPILRTGDYVYINPLNADFHGFIVIGWWKIRSCTGAAIYDQDIVDYPLTYLEAFNNPNIVKYAANNLALTVPYVVDFTGVQDPKPRPFYCTNFDEPDLDNDLNTYFSDHSWRFFTLPSQINIPVSQIYTNHNWVWRSQDGY